MTDATQLLRIGELSRRTGVRTETLRAWERRYGLVEPNRSEGGYRLYTPDDERRINAMNALIAAGTAPAEAARLARAGAGDPAADVGLSPDSEAERLRSALEGYDEERANAILDRAIAAFALDSLLGGVILPAMAALGDRWAGGEVSIAQEHFATSVAARAPARARPRMGRGRRQPRAARLPSRRAPRHRADRLRPLASPARLADRVPRPRYPTRDPGRGRRAPGAGGGRARGQLPGAVLVLARRDPRPDPERESAARRRRRRAWTRNRGRGRALGRLAAGGGRVRVDLTARLGRASVPARHRRRFAVRAGAGGDRRQ